MLILLTRMRIIVMYCKKKKKNFYIIKIYTMISFKFVFERMNTKQIIIVYLNGTQQKQKYF